MNKQIDRQLDSHTARQTGSRTDSQMDRHAGRQRDIHGGAVCSHGRDLYLADVGMWNNQQPVTSPTGSWIVVKSATHQEQGFKHFFCFNPIRIR
jgi:hypothetical protein